MDKVLDQNAAYIDRIKAFVADIIRPLAARDDGDNMIGAEVIAQMKALGLFGTLIPKAYGGLGLDLATHCAVMEELASGWVSVAGVLNPHVLCCNLVLTSGSDAQKHSLLPSMASGDLRCAFSLTEPHTGSDVQSITTAAEPLDDGGWSLTGHKRWITNGHAANMVFVLAITDPEAKPAHKGMTCFMVEKPPFADGDGSVVVEEIIDKMGDRGVETTDLVLRAHPCPASRVLGEKAGVNRGFAQMMQSMETGRIGASSMCVGVARRCLEVGLDYARTRETFGQKIGNHQAIQFKLADMATKIEAARLLTRNAARLKTAGARVDMAAGMAKLFASDAAVEVAEEAFRIHGSNGYSRSSEVERLYRDALSLVSAEGPSEIQRMIIGRTVFRDGI
ncbi:MAG: acyl-CoA dehydrogenase family protein [Pseudomonadota bacterium]|nr:acyl-CoA dehydrogenase family protein [Pseudomonadota bacterium]